MLNVQHGEVEVLNDETVATTRGWGHAPYSPLPSRPPWRSDDAPVLFGGPTCLPHTHPNAPRQVEVLCRQAVIQAAAGGPAPARTATFSRICSAPPFHRRPRHPSFAADIVAPSDMMDGRVGAIRDALVRLIHIYHDAFSVSVWPLLP